MSAPVEIAQGIESQLTAPLYGLDPKERHDSLLALLKKELAYACDRNPRFRNYVEHWPVHFHKADKLADLPYLPVGAFKSNPPWLWLTPTRSSALSLPVQLRARCQAV